MMVCDTPMRGSLQILLECQLQLLIFVMLRVVRECVGRNWAVLYQQSEPALLDSASGVDKSKQLCICHMHCTSAHQDIPTTIHPATILLSTHLPKPCLRNDVPVQSSAGTSGETDSMTRPRKCTACQSARHTQGRPVAACMTLKTELPSLRQLHVAVRAGRSESLMQSTSQICTTAK